MDVKEVYFKNSWINPPEVNILVGVETLFREIHIIRDGEAVICHIVT